MGDRLRDLRESIVRALAKVSLVLVLGLLGVFFVGSAGTATASSPPATEVATAAAPVGFGNADPMGIAFVLVMFAGGIAVLALGAFKPVRRDNAPAGRRRRTDALVD